jgi:hypothetical protein
MKLRRGEVLSGFLLSDILDGVEEGLFDARELRQNRL